MNRMGGVTEEEVPKPTFSGWGLMDRKVEGWLKNLFGVCLQASTHKTSCGQDETFRRVGGDHRWMKHLNGLASSLFDDCFRDGITHEKSDAFPDEPLFEPVEDSLSRDGW